MGFLSDLAQKLNMDRDKVRAILLELAEVSASTEEQDKVVEAASSEGLDFNKLRIVRRIHARLEAVEEILGYIENHPSWKKEEVLSYIRYSISLMRRVEKKVLPDFF